MTDGARSETRAVTRNDVARLAGVSTAVVSYVVNDGPRPVAEATRLRVLDAIEKLGYRPNAAARSLITGQSDLLGLIVPDVRNPYFATMAQSVEVAAAEQGLNLVLAQSYGDELPAAIRSLDGRLVVGVISASTSSAPKVRELSRSRVPIVLLSLALPRGPFPSVWPDFYQGGRSAVRHLVEEHGHTSVALVTGSEAMEERERAWRDVLEEAGLATLAVVRVPWTMTGGRDAATLLLERHPESTAVFVTSDQQALGLLSGLHQAGRRVPRDLAIASFDGSPEGEFAIPPLTSVAVPMAEMAREAVALITGGGSEQHSPYPTELVIRESCGCPRPGNATATD